MDRIQIDFSKKSGPIKPMHATNNGPVYKRNTDQKVTNLQSFQEAGIPYCRTHDSSEVRTYGAHHVVDISGIFPDFSRDPFDPSSYDFPVTDAYMEAITLCGAEVFYRLGQTIEHFPKKYDTLPPKDFHKWAVICEHVIRHYNEGWADGMHMGIQYWEIWNEADGTEDDAENKPTWGGTKQQFFEFYNVAASHLKNCFPDLKIGGPALACRLDWAEDFLSQLAVKPDFFSWHSYVTEPGEMVKTAQYVRKMLDRHGYRDTESILDEWNYIISFSGEDWIRSLRTDKSLKGASFIAAVMCACQYAPVDMLMYYNAAPHVMNGMFSADILSDRLKGYYPFVMFNTLYRLGNCVRVEGLPKGVYACAARADTEGAVMVTHYSDDDNAGTKELQIGIEGLQCPESVCARYYLLDRDHDFEAVREETFTGQSYALILRLPLYISYLIQFSYMTGDR